MLNENINESIKIKAVNDHDIFTLLKLSALDENYIEELAEKAFNSRGSELWNELQFFLYNLNVKLMHKGFSIGSSHSVKDWKIRNAIESAEVKVLSEEKIPDTIDNADKFMTFLRKRISEHRVNRNPLFDYFDNDDLSNEEMRYFLANYRLNMQYFHLHVAAYSLFVPFDMREELYHNLHDEFGKGDFSKAHPNLFEPLMNHFGGAYSHDINAESCFLLNTKINLCWFSKGLEYGLGGMGALELSIPLQQIRILRHLRRRGVSETLLEFFVVHCELDEDHGEGWFASGIPYLKSSSDFQKVFSGAMRMLDARVTVYDGILHGILNKRKKQINDTNIANTVE